MIPSGELIQLVSPKGKRYTMILNAEEELHTHDGLIPLARICDMDFGQAVATHLGREYLVLKPTLYDLLKNVQRKTQIIYPKDIGYILLKLGIVPGGEVLEAGSGSGSLTMALAWYSGPQGCVHSFERREEFVDLCARNLERVGLRDRVSFYSRDIGEGFGLSDIPAGFIDVRTPWDYVDQLGRALQNGAPAGFLLPTMNQVERLLRALEDSCFTDPEVLEILVRPYKPVADRLRPEDRMVAHTGYLIFCRVMK
ncbi:MAG: tRNA (adenine-N1)-methyltransferase [Desulfohalobiaceae bacterium]|nr:tRNA (adenine-N1)-methyltransferase [Desulfohalobiaceae bacterium]